VRVVLIGSGPHPTKGGEMKLLCLDTETTGLDFEKDVITEIGAVVWCTKKRTPLYLWNTNLLWQDTAEKLTPEITQITGIDLAHLEEFGERVQPEDQIFIDLAALMEKTRVCVAHNAPFDRGMLEAAFQAVGVVMPEVLWVDTCIDLPYPPTIKTRKLIHAAAEHGLCPIRFPHRALFDTLKTCELLDCYPIDEVIKRAKTPNVEIVAVCKKPWLDNKPDGEKDTDLAKQNGFHWRANEKQWVRLVKEFETEELTETLPFPIKVNEQ